MLAHMYHEMHEIVYHEKKSIVVKVYVLQIWAWEHLLVMRPIFEGEREPMESYICIYRGKLI